MPRKIPITDRWVIGSSGIEMYLTIDNEWTQNESDAMIFSTSFDASQKMHQLQPDTPYDLEVLDLMPSDTFNKYL